MVYIKDEELVRRLTTSLEMLPTKDLALLMHLLLPYDVKFMNRVINEVEKRTPLRTPDFI